MLQRRQWIASVALAAAARPSHAESVYPGADWSRREPAELGLNASALDRFRDACAGHGWVTRAGQAVYSWGETWKPIDIASACKPWFGHFLFRALQDGRLKSLDEPVLKWEPRLATLNAALGHKDRSITWRHLATQTSCYGVREAPGGAFDYNDFQIALFWDCLFLKLYGTTPERVDDDVLRPLLTAPLQCQDPLSMISFGIGARQGRIRASVRDLCRFGLLYMRGGRWKNQTLLKPELVQTILTSPHPNSLPRAGMDPAEMLSVQRTLGSQKVPDNQTDHHGSYSFLWWTNGVDRSGKRHWEGLPAECYACLGHGGKRGVLVWPSREIVAAWNDTQLNGRDSQSAALRHLIAAAG